MLQDNKTRVVRDEGQPVLPEEEGLADFVHHAIGILRRQYLVILFLTALGLGAGAIYLSVATPIYTAETSLYIALRQNPIDLQPGLVNDPIEIASQIQIIKSK